MATPKLTQSEFIRRAREVHGNTYTYAKTVYEYAKQCVTITCKKHGNFTQQPKKHYEGQGCPECGKQRQASKVAEWTTLARSEFLKRARAKFGTEFRYAGQYIDLTTEIKIKCPKHGWFTCTPRHHLRLTTGCPACGKNRLTTRQFIMQARTVHGRAYQYQNLPKLLKQSTRIQATCKSHGCFEVSVRKHLECAQGCKQCGLDKHAKDRIVESSKTFISRLKAVHGNRYDYSKVEYTGSKNLIDIICPEHGLFQQKASSHLKGKGCRACAFLGHSKVSIKWIEEEAKRRNLTDVWHAANGGEYLVPGTNFRVDGFHPKTKTVFEFYGDCFHGNPKLYRRTDRPHPFRDLTAFELYRRTKSREAVLTSLGYTVVSIWEKDYRESVLK